MTKITVIEIPNKSKLNAFGVVENISDNQEALPKDICSNFRKWVVPI